MKKFLTIIVMLLLCTVVLFACGKKDDPNTVASVSYTINAELSDTTLQCTQQTKVTNIYKEGIDNLTFMLYANAYSEKAEHRAYTGKLTRYGGITVSKVSVNGAVTEWTMGTDGQSMSFAVPTTKQNDEIVVDMEYAVVIPECNLRFGKTGDYINLSNFYPQVAFYGQDGFRADVFSNVGDPCVSAIADFDVNLTLAQDTVIAGSVPFTKIENTNGKTVLHAKGDNIRDFAMVINPNFTVATADANGVKVNYYSVGEEQAQAKADLAANAVKTFSERFGNYPYAEYAVVSTPFASEGMEFSGLCFINIKAVEPDLTIVHETAHQWWYGMVGNDNYNEGWLDEGLTTFTTAYYYKLNGNEEVYEKEMNLASNAYFKYEKLQKKRGDKGMLAMDLSLREYTDYQYNMLIYNKGSMLFHNLYETVGQQKFDAILKAYVHNNKFKTASRSDFIAACEQGAKCDMDGFINGWLSKSAAFTTFAA